MWAVDFFTNLVDKIQKLNKIILAIFAIIMFQKFCFTQTFDNNSTKKNYRVMFYNVENHFDSKYDSSKLYNDFTPGGELHWTENKYVKKRNNIYKVIVSVGGWKPVTLIGLAEIENEFVVSDLIAGTPLAKQGYKFVHYDSDDARGIDVALLYHTKSFTLINSKKIKIIDHDNPGFTTRDMLYVKGIISFDTIHGVVNHWTSRYRGHLESEDLRILASNTLIKLTDSICTLNPNAKILLIGDFNDNPTDKSMLLITKTSNCNFHNLNLSATNKDVLGTLKYLSSWSSFDQILVSGSLFADSIGIRCEPNGHIYDPDFLLLPDVKNLGLKTNRTNIGFKYQGGFSDHLPVYVDLVVKH